MKDTMHKPNITIPTLSDVSPNYVALLDKRTELTTKLRDHEKEMDELRGLIIFKPNATHSDRTSARIANLLGEATASDKTSDRARYTELLQLTTDIKIALQVLNDRIGTERFHASRLICEKLSSAHKKLIENMANKMLELNSISKEYRNLINELQRADVSTSPLVPVGLRFVESIERFLNEAANDGHISKDSIAKELRQ
jgi:hypothetical protein